jgi:PKD repeat protein
MARHLRYPILALMFGALLGAASARAAEQATVELSSTSATRAVAVSSPTIDAPPSVTAPSDLPLTIQADATDPDGSDILTITATGYPASLTLNHVPSGSPASATLTGTPSSADVGGYSIQWNVSDGTGGSASTMTQLTVTQNSPPSISSPATVNGAETIKMTFAVTVSDPDGDTVGSLTASSMPSGATFTPSGFNTAGEFLWTPAIGQQGTYDVTFTATSGSPGRSASTTSHLIIGPVDHPPVMTGIPATINAVPNVLITFNVTVSDPDGDAITFFVIRGTQNTPLPTGATFTHNANNTFGTFSWTPTPDQISQVHLDCIAESGILTLRTLLVCNIVVRADRPPVVTAPATATVAEGMPLTVNITAADPDNTTPITSLIAGPLPFGATFTHNAANTTGTLQWTSDFTQAGTYSVTFTASNTPAGTTLSGSRTTVITVTDVNRAPVANPGGPYSGVVGLPISFNGSGSNDPDGNTLTYAWDFGDGMTGTGATPSHSYAAGGSYSVSLMVTDNGTPALSNTATTTATISQGFDARVFTSGGNKTIKLNSGKPTWCASIEPVGTSFSVDDVDLGTIKMHYAGNQIAAIPGKTAVASDQDHNGVQELGACFSKDDLRTLFAGLPGGHNTVTVMIDGSLVSGAHFTGSIEVDVQAPGGGALAASLSPNPFNPSAVLTFSTHTAGHVRVRLFDASGRLVKTLVDEPYMTAGIHDVHVGARNDTGGRLASGIYFYHIETAEGSFTGRAAIVQ